MEATSAEPLVTPLLDVEQPSEQPPSNVAPNPSAAQQNQLRVTLGFVTVIVVVTIVGIWNRGYHLSFKSYGYDTSCDTKSAEFNYTQERTRFELEHCTWSNVNKPFRNAKSGLFSVAGFFSFVYNSSLLALPFIFKPDPMIGKRQGEAVKEYAEVVGVLASRATYLQYGVCWTKRLNNMVFFAQYALFLFKCLTTSWFQRPYAWDVAMNDFFMTFRVQLLAPVVLLIAQAYSLARTFKSTYSGHVLFYVPLGFLWPLLVAILPLFIYLPAVLTIVLLAELWWWSVQKPLTLFLFLSILLTLAIEVSYVEDWYHYWWVSVFCGVMLCCCGSYYVHEVEHSDNDNRPVYPRAPLHRRSFDTEQAPPTFTTQWFEDVCFILGLPCIVFLVSVFSKRALCANSAICTGSTFTLIDISFPSPTSSFVMGGSLVDVAIISVAATAITFVLRRHPMDLPSNFIGLSNANVLWRLQYVDQVSLWDVIWPKVHQIKDVFGQTPLLGTCCEGMDEEYHSRALSRMLDSMEQLEQLSMKMDILEQKPWDGTYKGFTALLVAAQNGYADKVKSLLEHNANVNAWQDDSENTSLMLAAIRHHEETVQIILDNPHCELDLLNRDGHSALICAVEQEDVSIAHAILRAMMRRRPEVQVSCESGQFSVLVLAIQKRHLELAQTCVEARANLGFRSPARAGDTPLMIAAEHGNEDIFQLLLEKDRDRESGSASIMEARHEDERTVLMQVAWDNKSGLIELLYKYRANISATDCKRRNALDYAKWNNCQVAKDLLKTLWKVEEYPRTSDQEGPEWENFINVGIVGATSSGKSTWINHQCNVSFKDTIENLSEQLLEFLEEGNDGKATWLQAAKDWPKPEKGIKKGYVLFCIVSLPDLTNLTRTRTRTKPWTFNRDVSHGGGYGDGGGAGSSSTDVGAGKRSLMEELKSFIMENMNKEFRFIFTQKRAAMMGSDETTMAPTAFKSDSFPGITIWDLPGSGTRNYPEETYCKLLGLKYYDMVVLICTGYLSESNEQLLVQLHACEVPCIILCNKIDIDIESNANDFFMSPDETINLVRASFLELRCKNDLELFDDKHLFFTTRVTYNEKHAAYKIVANERLMLETTINNMAKEKVAAQAAQAATGP